MAMHLQTDNRCVFFQTLLNVVAKMWLSKIKKKLMNRHTHIHLLNAAVCITPFSFHLLFNIHFVVDLLLRLYLLYFFYLLSKPKCFIRWQNTINNSSRFIFCFICCGRVSLLCMYVRVFFFVRLPFAFWICQSANISPVACRRAA